jgi:ureidoglycolate hydrolase
MDGLETPSLRIATWPTIYYTKIAFEPYGTFIDRLTTNFPEAKEVKTSKYKSTKEQQACDGSDSYELDSWRGKSGTAQA